jgi:hypothetical protein
VQVYGPGDVLGELEFGRDYWLGFSTMLVGQPMDEYVTLLQFKGRPDKNGVDPYEGARNPYLALRHRMDQMQLDIKYDWKHNTWESGEREYSGSRSWNVGPLAYGQWIDWVLHVRLDYRRDGQGLIELWRDGTQIVDYAGPNCYNDARGGYIKLGAYCWDWYDCPSKPARILYHDEIAVASPGSYAVVVPGQ